MSLWQLTTSSRLQVYPLASSAMTSERPSTAEELDSQPPLFTPEQQLWIERLVASRGAPSESGLLAVMPPSPSVPPPATSPGNIGERIALQIALACLKCPPGAQLEDTWACVMCVL